MSNNNEGNINPFCNSTVNNFPTFQNVNGVYFEDSHMTEAPETSLLNLSIGTRAALAPSADLSNINSKSHHIKYFALLSRLFYILYFTYYNSLI